MNNLFFPKEKFIKFYIYIIVFLIIVLLYIIKFYEFEEYDSYYGEINDEYLVILVEKNNINNITNKILINNVKKDCEINKINRNYILNTDYKLYHEIYYKCDLSKEELAKGYILDIKISKGNTTILNKIKNNF